MGTTVNEGGVGYKTLYKTIHDFGIDIKKEHINDWHGINKYQVLNHYLSKYSNKQNKQLEVLKKEIYTNFDNNIKYEYKKLNSIKLIHPNMHNLFKNIKKNNIKICLNTGFNKEIQEHIIKNLKMKSFIDDYISSEDVLKGRPEPYMINYLSNKYNILPSSIIKIGDTKNDILEGFNANCLASVGVISGADNFDTLSEVNPDIILNSVMDIGIVYDNTNIKIF